MTQHEGLFWLVVIIIVILFCFWSRGYGHMINCLESPSFISPLVRLNTEEKYIQCASKEEAYDQAKYKSHGRNPLFHDRPHKDGQQSHYHPHKHLYAIENGRFVNYHFCFGPRKFEDGRIFH